jgi:membrane protease YdiL (CAAX protease family)
MGPLKPDQVLPFVISAAAGTFLYTWVFNNTRGSIWMVILMHAASNATSRLLSEIIPLDTALPAPFHVISPDWFNAIAFILAAVIVVIATRGRLGYRQTAEPLAETKLTG